MADMDETSLRRDIERYRRLMREFSNNPYVENALEKLIREAEDELRQMAVGDHL